jgi:putative DNA primase/helicase
VIVPGESNALRLFLDAFEEQRATDAAPDHLPATSDEYQGDQTLDDQPGGSANVAPSGPEPLPAVFEGDQDPHRLARLFLDEHRHPDGPLHVFWREEHYRWDGSAWRPLPDKELRAELCQAIKREADRLNAIAVQQWRAARGTDAQGKSQTVPTAFRVTNRLGSDVLHALAGLTVLPSSVNTPCWLGNAHPPLPAEEMIACRNGLVHVPSFAEGDRTVYPATPQFFSQNALDYRFDPDAGTPREWLRFLRALWPDDQQAREALQEWFGYLLLPDTSQQKILLMCGPRRSGKGTVARVLRRLVGEMNVCAPTLSGLGTNFGLWPLLGKTVATVSDARLSGRTDAAVVVERLLSISGEDAQTIDRKNLSQVTAKLPVRFVILTNELPRLADSSGALVGRLIVLRLTRSWYGQEDKALTDKLLAELPGILLWAIAGWKRLQERGRFVQPDSGHRMVEDMEDLSSPIGAFIRECCEVGAGHEVAVKELFDRWKRWCEDKGRKEAGTEQVFGRDLRAAVPGIDVRQPRTESGRVRFYTGLRIRHEDEIPEGI